jgi:hypothetical protein
LPRRGNGRPARQAGPDLSRRPLQSRGAGLPLQSGLSRLSRQARLQHARLTGSQPGLQARLSLRARLLRTPVLPLQAWTACRTLPALNLALGDDLAPEILRGVNLTHKTPVAQRLLRRDQQRHGGKAAARAGADGETGGALGEETPAGRRRGH